MKSVHIQLGVLELIVVGEYEEFCPGDKTTPPGGGTFDAHEINVQNENIFDLVSSKKLEKINQLCYDKITDATY